MLTEGRACFSPLHAGTSFTRRPLSRKPSRAAALPIVAENRRQVTTRDAAYLRNPHLGSAYFVCCRETILRSVNVGVVGALFTFGAAPRPKLGESFDQL